MVWAYAKERWWIYWTKNVEYEAAWRKQGRPQRRLMDFLLFLFHYICSVIGIAYSLTIVHYWLVQ